MSDPTMLSYEMFLNAINNPFHVEQPGGANGPGKAVELVLADLSARVVQGGYEQFSLFFHGSGDRLLLQGTYQVSSAHIGVFPLFVVPIGRDEKGFRYQSVFNRILTP